MLVPLQYYGDGAFPTTIRAVDDGEFIARIRGRVQRHCYCYYIIRYERLRRAANEEFLLVGMNPGGVRALPPRYHTGVRKSWQKVIQDAIDALPPLGS